MTDLRDVRVSELALFQRCRRRWYLSYEMGFERQGVEAGIGTAFHSLLAEYYGKEMGDEDMAHLASLGPEAHRTVSVMFATYVTEVENEGLDVGIDTLALELRIDKPVGPIRLSGQIDHLYYDPTVGGVVVQDTKTVGNFFTTAQRDFQLMTYAWLAQQEGYDVRAIEHNIVKRNKRTAAAKPPFVQRNRHLVSKAEIDKWGQSLGYMAATLYETVKAAEYSGLGAAHPIVYPKATNECEWYCPFASVCGMLDDPDADWLGVLHEEYEQKGEAPHE